MKWNGLRKDFMDHIASSMFSLYSLPYAFINLEKLYIKYGTTVNVMLKDIILKKIKEPIKKKRQKRKIKELNIKKQVINISKTQSIKNAWNINNKMLQHMIS